jgi:hypothetical protein
LNINKSDLTLEQLIILQSELKHAEKSLALAYFMLIGGHLGVHRFYLKRPVSGSLQLALFVIATVFYYLFAIAATLNEESTVPYFFLGLCLVSAVTLFIWIIVDMCIIPRYVREWNSEQERQLIERLTRQ